MRKLTAVIAALGFLSSTMLTPVVAASHDGVTTTDDDYVEVDRHVRQTTGLGPAKARRTDAPRSTVNGIWDD